MLDEAKDDQKNRLPVAFCVALRRSGMRKSLFQFFISAEVVRNKHYVLPTEFDHTTNTLTWKSLKGFKPLVQVIKEQYDLVKAGHTVVLMRAVLTSVGCLQSGRVDCAKVGKAVELVKLEAPTANFIRKCQGQQTAVEKKFLKSSAGVSEAAASAAAAEPTAGGLRQDLQELGLNILAEEAEVRARESVDDPDADLDEDGCGHDFEDFVSRGLAYSQERQDDQEDACLEEAAIESFKQQSGEDVAAAFEKGVALDTIAKKECDIESADQQSIICQLQNDSNLQLDALDATFEAAFAKANGMDVLDGEGDKGIETHGPPEDGVWDGFQAALTQIVPAKLSSEIDPENVDLRAQTFEEWVSQCSEGFRLLMLQKDHSGFDGEFNGVSIASFQPPDPPNEGRLRRVEIVQWQWSGHSVTTRGRVASVDKENRLKSIMAVGANKDPIDFSLRDLEIIWRDTGVKIVKAKWKVNQNQNVMPDHLMRVLAMFREAEGVAYVCFLLTANAVMTLRM
eukprot:s125_g21.t1